MTSVGETLKRERQKRNLDLDQVSRELKIAPRFLDAIEHEQYNLLPGGVFAKSFVRQYARLMDIDEEEAAAEVQRTIAQPGPPLEEIARAHAAHPGPVVFAPRVDSISNRSFSSGSWLPALALVVAVMLGCSLVYGWWQRDRHAVSAAAPTPNRLDASTQTAAAQLPAGQLPAAPVSISPAQSLEQSSAQLPAARPQPNAVSPDTPTKTAALIPAATSEPPLKPSGPVKVEISTTEEPVWILARTDGKYAFSGTIEANQTRTVEADGTVLLRLGNAGGVAITVNGKTIPAVGPKGQVRTVQLTSGGFQIVAPPKPSAPPDAPI